MEAYQIQVGKVLDWTRQGDFGPYETTITVTSLPDAFDVVTVERRFPDGGVRTYGVKARFLHLPFYVQDVTVGDKLMWQRKAHDEQRVYYVEVTVLEPPEEGNIKVEWNHPEPNRDGSRPAGPTHHTVAQRYLFTETMARMLRERTLRAKERILEGARTSSRIAVPAATRTVAHPVPAPMSASPDTTATQVADLKEEVESLRTDTMILAEVVGQLTQNQTPTARQIEHIQGISRTGR